MYAMLGLSAIGFIVHAIAKYGLKIANRRMSLNWMLSMAIFNLIGAAMYGTRVCQPLCCVPEAKLTALRSLRSSSLEPSTHVARVIRYCTSWSSSQD
jgi:predicted membrane channel-forming protein YqfA (hemolysin III family)